MARLGVSSSVLDGYRDSGMAGMPSASHPRALTAAPLTEVATAVADHVRRVRPDVVVTYDRHGGYAHPDHIRTHDATRVALALLAADDDPALPSRAFEIRTPRSWAEADRRWLLAHVDPRHGLTLLDPDDAYPPGVVDDGAVSHVVVDPGAVAAQADALAAHPTQVTLYDDGHGPYYALSNDVAARLSGREGFARVDPVTWHDLPPDPDTGPGWGAGLLAP